MAGYDYIQILDLKERLHAQFRIKGLGALKYFLGIEVTHFS